METTVAEWMTAVGTLAGGLGAIGILAVASQGVNAWREQMLGKEEYDVAKSVIKALLMTRAVSHEFRLSCRIVGKRKKWDLWKSYEKVIDALDSVSADASLLWGRDWDTNKFYEIRDGLFEMAHGSECEIDTLESQLELCERVYNDASVLIDEMRLIALGRRSVQ